MASDSSSSYFSRPPAWRCRYDAVLQEQDPFELFQKIEVAEAAILTRREALQQTSAFYPEEPAEIAAALANLRVLKKEQRRFR
jgi:hypothetical protein